MKASKIAETKLWWEIHSPPSESELSTRFERLLRHVRTLIGEHGGLVPYVLVEEAHRICSMRTELLEDALVDNMRSWSQP